MTHPFAHRIRSGLTRTGLTLRELCRRAGMDPSLLSKVLSGKRAPPAEESVLRRLAGALEIPAEELVVSAGLVPESWARLNEDPQLFHRVSDAIVSGHGPALQARPARAAFRPARAPGLLREMGASGHRPERQEGALGPELL